MTSVAEVTTTPKRAHRVRKTESETMLVQITVLGFFAYLVKSQTFKARVALGAIALVKAEKKTAAAGIPFVMLVGLLKTGPKPLA